MTKPSQTFHRGDLVHVAQDLGHSMSHFRNDFDAVVMGSYADQYGGNDTESYTLLHADTGNQSSWYNGPQLTLIRHVGEDGIKAIESERVAREAIETDMAWIIANWNRIRSNLPGATMGELMRRIGIDNPWGNQGEGVVLYENMRRTFAALDPVLQTGNSVQIIARIEEIRAKIGKAPR